MPTVTVPTYEDAQLVLKLYELRREEKLRAARDWFISKFFPQTADDVTALTGTENAYYRMVTTYWEMAASFVVRGILNADLFLASGAVRPGPERSTWYSPVRLMPSRGRRARARGVLRSAGA